MKSYTHRKSFSRMLLFVYAGILLVMSVHMHQERAVNYGESCYECNHHLPHNGHFASSGALMHDCVLCQLSTTSYVAPVVLELVQPATAVAAQPGAEECLPQQLVTDLHLSRAPPALPVF